MEIVVRFVGVTLKMMVKVIQELAMGVVVKMGIHFKKGNYDLPIL
jgi:hypothetical protein